MRVTPSPTEASPLEIEPPITVSTEPEIPESGPTKQSSGLMDQLMAGARELASTTVRGAETALGMGLVVGGTVISEIQCQTGLEGPRRKLNEDERTLLRKVFGESVDFNAVNIVTGPSGVFGANDRAFTLGNTIYVKGDVAADGNILSKTLVHEIAHVWQFQHGGFTYAGAAVAAQAAAGSGAYEWRAAVNRGATWAELNPEQQAQLVEDLFGAQVFSSPQQPLRFVDNGVDRTALAESVRHALKNGKGAP